jgi:hypothetical protein
VRAQGLLVSALTGGRVGLLRAVVDSQRTALLAGAGEGLPKAAADGLRVPVLNGMHDAGFFDFTENPIGARECWQLAHALLAAGEDGITTEEFERLVPTPERQRALLEAAGLLWFHPNSNRVSLHSRVTRHELRRLVAMKDPRFQLQAV